MSEQNEQPTNSLEVVPANVMREVRRLIVENCPDEQLDTTLQEAHKRLCCKEKAQPARVELEEKQ